MIIFISNGCFFARPDNDLAKLQSFQIPISAQLSHYCGVLYIISFSPVFLLCTVDPHNLQSLLSSTIPYPTIPTNPPSWLADLL